MTAAGVVTAMLWRARAEATTDPVAMVHPTIVSAILREGRALDPRPTGKLTPPSPGDRTRLVYWTQPSYAGTTDGVSVATLIRSGRADSLEFRLKTEHMDQLRGQTAAIDLALRDLGLLIVRQEDAVKEKLRGDPQRSIVLKAKPHQRDPRWPDVERLERETKYEHGVVWGDKCDDGVIYFIVLWNQFPGLKSLCDDRFALIAQRKERVRDAIAELYRSHGPTIFE